MARRIDPWLLGILLISFGLSTYHLDWGLPNGNESWAADALGPVTVLGILHHSFSAWNSGWFYFKYPMGYPLLLAVSFAPYLGYLFVAGAWKHPSTAYPFGFAHPEHALFVLALIGRLISVLCAVGTVALTYLIGRRLFDRWTGRLAALLAATAYPIVYYAHTTNLDGSYLFWLTLALYCAIAASETERWLPWVTLGIAAAMAVSTKEQGFAFLLPLPVLALAARVRAQRSLRVLWGAPVWWMAGAAIGTVVLANNVAYNPLGFVARIAFLLGRPLHPINARLAPVEFAWFKGVHEWVYLSQLWDGMDSALGTPLACLAAAGAVALWRTPRQAVWLVVPVVVHYYLSLRGLDLITLRYLLPFYVVGALLAAALLTRLYRGTGTPMGRRVIAALAVLLVALGLARAIELDWTLRTDARYQAEAWLAANVPARGRAEVYQKPVYMPRFPSGVDVNVVPMSERSIRGLQRRRPDVIVLSSASRQSVSHVWAQDWKANGALLAPVPEAVELVRGIETDRVGYRRVGVFRQQPWLLRSRLTSICPEITIYARHDQ